MAGLQPYHHGTLSEKEKDFERQRFEHYVAMRATHLDRRALEAWRGCETTAKAVLTNDRPTGRKLHTSGKTTHVTYDVPASMKTVVPAGTLS